jgi:anti-sigma regulatory factor (Ser/Thr protein kinase)
MKLTVEVGADPDAVGVLRYLAAESARRAGLDEDQVEDVKVAVTELASNALEAEQRRATSDAIRVEITIDDPFSLSVYDRGDGLDPQSVGGRTSSKSEEGLGLVITEVLVDRLLVEPRSGGGSKVSVWMGRRP